LSGTVRPPSRRGLRHLAPLMLLLGTMACTTTFTTDLRQAFSMDPAATPDEAAPPVPEHYNDQPGPPAARTGADQLGSDEPNAPGGTAAMSVAQVSEADSISAGYSQPILNSDDPCSTQPDNVERCGPSALPAPKDTCRACGTDAEMTLLAPKRAQAGNFDPAVAVQEIGRGRTVSQASQSVGNAFLTAPETPAEPAPEAIPIPLEGLESILPGAP